MKLRFAVGAALAVLLAACKSPAQYVVENDSEYREAINELGVPRIQQGELDTMWEYFLMKRSECGVDEDLCTLYDYAIADTFLSQVLAGFVGQPADQVAPPGMTNARFREVQKIICDHQSVWLKDIVHRQGWFTIGKYGEDADSAAFFLLQHSDDLGLQKQILPKLEVLAEAGEVKAKRVALLSDRIAIQEGKEQLYGTQGDCNGSLDWSPFPISEPEHVDEKRERMGLPPMESYREIMANTYCNSSNVSVRE